MSIMQSAPPCRVRRLGRIDYADALRMQEGMVRLRREDKIPDTLLLLEHPHVITLGVSSDAAHVVADEAERRRLGIELFETGRGGDVTYHGPGQLVGYPILQLEAKRRDAHAYLRALEECLILTLADFAIAAQRQPGATGVWIGEGEQAAKIAAIGVRLSHWITSHGFALNVQTDLSYFETIVPCGIADRPVASMHQVLGRAPAMERVEDRIVAHFGEVFGRTMSEAKATD
jgi:lipoyl(octanoyl) transferase